MAGPVIGGVPWTRLGGAVVASRLEGPGTPPFPLTCAGQGVIVCLLAVDKGKPPERGGRKATGLPEFAGLPKNSDQCRATFQRPNSSGSKGKCARQRDRSQAAARCVPPLWLEGECRQDNSARP